MDDNKPTVLCIDDDSFTLAHIKESLADQFKLIFAIDPDVGFELAVKKCPDLILLDLNMPKMNGFELADMTSKLSMTKHIPVVFLTAFATDEIKQTAKALNAAGFVSKPFDPAELRTQIENALNQAPA